MEVIKLPKKFRMVCYEIMDGKEEALTALETFADKYPHQVAAIKAEVAYFNLDYETALNLDLTVLPFHPIPPGRLPVKCSAFILRQMIPVRRLFLLSLIIPM